MMGVLIKYSEFYGESYTKDPLELIKHLPKKELLLTISKINTLLNPQNSVGIDYSYETQFECVKTITDQDPKQETYHYLPIEKRFKNNFSESHTFFTRTTCLFALNEIVNSDIFLKSKKTEYFPEERIGIFKYLLVCNELILDLSEKYSSNELNKNNIDSLEFYAFNSLPLNQYIINENPMTTFYRAWLLFVSIQKDKNFSTHLKNYTTEKFGTDNFLEFFKYFVYHYFKSYDKNLKLNYINISKTDVVILNILNSFSELNEQKEIDYENVKTLDFLAIKKSPLYKLSRENNPDYESYLILDSKFLLNKVYSLFFNDFWFDFLKVRTTYKRSDWGKFIGSNYFESVVNEILHFSFINRKEYTFKKYNELEFDYKNKNTIEIADVLISKGKRRLFLAEVKSSYINMVEGYKSVTDVNSFLRIKREDFYKKFGLYQLVEKTIGDFHDYKRLLEIDSLNTKKRIQIYPAIIVNENILSIGTFSFILRKIFNDLLIKNGISRKSEDFFIKPLLVITIEQLQMLEQSVSDGSVDFFNFLDDYYYKIKRKKNTPQRVEDTLTSLTHLIHKKISSKKQFPLRLKTYNWLLMKD